VDGSDGTPRAGLPRPRRRLYDAGKSPEWPSDRVITLRDEVALIEPVLARAGTPLVLVGHSYGAAVALIAALDRPERVRGLAVYEPTLFSVIEGEGPPPNDADGIRDAVAAAAARSTRATATRLPSTSSTTGWDRAAGAIRRRSASRRSPPAASTCGAGSMRSSPSRRRSPPSQALDVPVLYMTGARSTAPHSGVARLLCSVLPRVERLEFADAGHMGPITHAGPVNEAIAQFLARLPASPGADRSGNRSIRSSPSPPWQRLFASA
jgi:pimeloyl-ACP methyl ester carboxylesterase